MDKAGDHDCNPSVQHGHEGDAPVSEWKMPGMRGTCADGRQGTWTEYGLAVTFTHSDPTFVPNALGRAPQFPADRVPEVRQVVDESFRKAQRDFPHLIEYEFATGPVERVEDEDHTWLYHFGWYTMTLAPDGMYVS